MADGDGSNGVAQGISTSGVPETGSPLNDANNHCAITSEHKTEGDGGSASSGECDSTQGPIDNNHTQMSLNSVPSITEKGQEASIEPSPVANNTSLAITKDGSPATQSLLTASFTSTPVAVVANPEANLSCLGDQDMDCSNISNAKECLLLKKDDSGIEIERSPGKHSSISVMDDTLPSQNIRVPEDSHLSIDTDENKQRGDRPSVTESEGVVADHVEMEEGLDVATAMLRSEEDIQIDPVQAIASDTRSCDEDEDIPGMERRLQSRLPFRGEGAEERMASRDTDDDNSDEEDNESDNEADRKSTSEEEEMEIDLEPPVDRWRPLEEVWKRQMGYSNHIPTSNIFRTRTGGSITLARRLKLFTKMESHDGCVNALHFNETGSLLASGSDDLNIVIWDWVRSKPAFTFDSGHRSNVFQCKFMPYTGDCHLVSCARDGQVRLAELSAMETCKGTRKLAQHKGAAHKLALLEDSSHIFYSCGEDAAMMEIDLRQEKPNKLGITKENDRKIALYSIHANPFKSYEYCVGGRDHYIRIYDKRMINEETKEEGVVKKFCPSHLVDNDLKANVTCAVYNYNGMEVLGTYNDEDIYLFDTTHSDGASHIKRYKGHRNNATVKGVNFYGPQSEFVVSGSDCGNVFLWDKDSEKIVQYFHGDEGGVVNVLEPHPNIPLLATSGLDHDVKIWLPNAKEPTQLDGLKQVIKRNKKERDEERSSEPDMIDSQMLWFLMQNLRRSARRRARQEGEEISSTSESENDSDDSDEPNQPVSCAQS